MLIEFMKGVVSSLSKEIERKIEKIYNKVFQEIFSTHRAALLVKGDRVRILNTVELLESSDAYDKFAKKFAKELAKLGIKHQRGIWRKYYKAAKRLHNVTLPMTYEKWEFELMSKAVRHNFTMIKSIPKEVIKIMEHKYTSNLIEEVAKGKLPRGSFMKELAKHGHKNAKLIARTETSKLQSSIIENRAKDIGSKAYIWLASNDKRTRPSHKAMNGVVVFWRDNDLEKPHLDNMYGNAGEFPNCRCAPKPIFDKYDLTKSTYKVYNYNTGKIIEMKKTQLMYYIEEGFLEQGEGKINL